ncbi:hypothetical protein ES319_D13G136600v1 [Gossypium barbadense]|uniref:Uncharacterized protein n=1 Tax=Gossypium barbadense TaxID=3634 RepID=A0A5J5NLC7_GOSBA|nr:hypothetical protein ES319_D13G136600v1 [Gossypium barbadense]
MSTARHHCSCLQMFVERTWRSPPRDVRRLEASLEARRLMLGFRNPSFSINFGPRLGISYWARY